jgi:hypothetical protein
MLPSRFRSVGRRWNCGTTTCDRLGRERRTPRCVDGRGRQSPCGKVAAGQVAGDADAVPAGEPVGDAGAIPVTVRDGPLGMQIRTGFAIARSAELAIRQRRSVLSSCTEAQPKSQGFTGPNAYEFGYLDRRFRLRSDGALAVNFRGGFFSDTRQHQHAGLERHREWCPDALVWVG